MKLADRRQEQELLVLKEDRAAQRQVDVMMAARGMSRYELLATSSNAAIIADIMKHGASAKATVGVANAQAMGSQGTSSREQALQQQLLDSQKENMDKVIAAYKEAMQGQQSGFQQFGTTVESVTRNLAPQPPHVIAGGGAAPSVPGRLRARPVERRSSCVRSAGPKTRNRIATAAAAAKNCETGRKAAAGLHAVISERGARQDRSHSGTAMTSRKADDDDSGRLPQQAPPPAPVSGSNDLMKTEEVLGYLGISRTKLWQLVNKEGLPAFKIGGDYRYRRSEIDAWIEKQRVQPEKPQDP